MNITLYSRQLIHKDFNKVTSEHRTAIMGLAMFSVMLFHQQFFKIVPFNFFHNFGSWGVDVFLFISGMGLVQSLKKNSLSVYYKRRAKRIMPSCILCGTTKYVFFLLFFSSMTKLKEELDLGWWSLASLDLWFIYTILIFYVISPLLYNLLHKWPFMTFAVIIVAMFVNGLTIRPVFNFEWESPLGIFSWTTERLPVFAAGMLVSIKKDWINENKSYSILFFLIAIGIKILEKSGNILHGHQTYSFIALTLGMPTLIITNIYFLKIVPGFFNNFIIFMGKYSLELYLVHEFIFWSLKFKYANVNSLLLLTTAFVFSTLFAFLCKYIINKVLP